MRDYQFKLDGNLSADYKLGTKVFFDGKCHTLESSCGCLFTVNRPNIKGSGVCVGDLLYNDKSWSLLGKPTGKEYESFLFHSLVKRETKDSSGGALWRPGTLGTVTKVTCIDRVNETKCGLHMVPYYEWASVLLSTGEVYISYSMIRQTKKAMRTFYENQ